MEGYDGFGGHYHEDNYSAGSAGETSVSSVKSRVPSQPVVFDEHGVLFAPPFLWRAASWVIAALIVGFLVFAVQSLTDTQVALGAFVTIVLGLAAGELLPILKAKIEKGFGP